MVSIKINGATIKHEHPVQFVEDKTEEYNLGSLIITNSTRREPYEDFSDVEVISDETFEAMIQRDTVKRIAPNKYEHEIAIVEPVLKLSMYVIPNRKFDTYQGTAIPDRTDVGKTTYLYQLQTMLKSVYMGKTNPFTIATATQTFLSVEADEKEYFGGDLFKNVIDLFRSLKAVPTLTLDNEIGHETITDLGDEISFDRIDGEIITSDIKDYSMRVHAKVVNGTYEADLIAGGTYYPADGYGVTVRSLNEKYDDDDAVYIIDSNIRRVIECRAKNISTINLGVLTNLLINVVSKEEWDNLTSNRERGPAGVPGTMVFEDDYKNNTLYYEEGDNLIQNVGVKYGYNGTLAKYAGLDEAIRRAVYIETGDVTEYDAQNISDIELQFYYQPVRDIDIVQERADISRVTKRTTYLNNQKDSTTELKRQGEANKGLINRMGNDTYQITVKYFDANTNVIPKSFDYTSDGYRIIKRTFEFMQSSTLVTFMLTKNQSIINPVISVNRSLSPFTIRKRNILTNFMYEEYVEIGYTQRTDDTECDVSFMRKVLLNALSYSASDDKPIYNAQYTRDGVNYINMSVQSVPMGNSFQFNTQFQSQKTAGYQIVSDAIGKQIIAVAYTDDNGQVENAQLYYGEEAVVDADLHPVGAFFSTWYHKTPLLNVELQPNEIFGMTSVLHCIGVDGIIVGPKFTENNSIIKTLGLAQNIEVSIYPSTTQFTIYDRYKPSGATSTTTLSVNKILGNFAFNSNEGVKWCINDSVTDEIYFSSNEVTTDTETQITLSFQKNRLSTIDL